MPRIVFSVKIREDLKKEFTNAVKEKNLSTCFVVEALLTAWLEGLKATAQATVDQKATIVVNQNFTRTFVRGRRFLGAGKKDQFKDVDVHGEVNETNCYDPRFGWFFKGDEALNDNRHAFGCLCSVCR